MNKKGPSSSSSSTEKRDAYLYHPETGELLQGLRSSLLSLDGRFEYPDPVPMEQPVSTLRPTLGGMRALVQEFVQRELSSIASSMEMETFEESDDFDIEDDPIDPLTPYERVFDPKDNEKMAAAGVGEVRGGSSSGTVSSAPSDVSPNGQPSNSPPGPLPAAGEVKKP